MPTLSAGLEWVRPGAEFLDGRFEPVEGSGIAGVARWW